MFLLLKIAFKFAVVAVAATLACTVIWETAVNGRLYSCTDPGWLGYWSPGNWVHHPVAVDHVVTGLSMSEPDTIKQGWTVAGLWRLWFAFVIVSFAISASLALLPWIPARSCQPQPRAG
jgi:hypothetical protein